ncbi:MAG: class I SAM-dependent methyltransferase [Methanotrichaceae archaeon]|nr:class I SAM-dependent methyltransferase [Methanotrichaceae archaeon]
MESKFDFGEKYTKANIATSYLINRFFLNVEKLIKTTSPKKVLEVGCGEGFSTKRLLSSLEADTSLEAIDIEKRLINAAKIRNPDVPYYLGSVYKLPFRDNSFDLIIALEVLEHLEYPEYGIREILRVTKKWAIISVPNEPLFRMLNIIRLKYITDFGNTPGHIQHWSRPSFKNFMEKDANIISVCSSLPWTVVLAKKFLK